MSCKSCGLLWWWLLLILVVKAQRLLARHGALHPPGVRGSRRHVCPQLIASSLYLLHMAVTVVEFDVVMSNAMDKAPVLTTQSTIFPAACTFKL
mmetsp:Transcript_116535/g.226666  ORF Transcript_116535/g.226666 Transcript_116535/m.226666 type:complete len:94 (+) Transcript_116535:289-570(+)